MKNTNNTNWKFINGKIFGAPKYMSKQYGVSERQLKSWGIESIEIDGVVFYNPTQVASIKGIEIKK